MIEQNLFKIDLQTIRATDATCKLYKYESGRRGRDYLVRSGMHDLITECRLPKGPPSVPLEWLLFSQVFLGLPDLCRKRFRPR